MAKKQYKSVAEMARRLARDKAFSDKLEKRIADRKIVKQLVALRSAKSLSQAEIAKAMGCTQSRISKLESGVDSDLRLGDLENYLDALGLASRVLVARKGSSNVETFLGELLTS